MGLLASFIAGISLFQISAYFPLTVILVVLSASFVIIRRLGVSGRSVALILCIISGLCYVRIVSQPPAAPDKIAGQTVVVEGTPVSEAVTHSGAAYGFSQVFEVRHASDKEGLQLPLGELRILTEEPLEPGTRYELLGRIPRDAFSLNPGEGSVIAPLYVSQARRTGETRTGLFRRMASSLNRVLSEKLSPESSAFLMSVLTGERGMLKPETREAFNITGLAHILSISGAHFGLLLIFLFQAIRFGLRFAPERALIRMTLFVTPSQLAAILSVPVVTLYFLISSGGFPALRSFVMIGLFLLGLLIQRRGFWLNTLCLAAVFILLIEPGAVLNLSFELSFLAVLSIGAVTELLRPDKPGEDTGKRSGFLRAALLSLSVSLAATAGTAPLAAYHFHSFSVVSPLTNLLITPLIGFVILPMGFLSSVFFLLTGSFPAASLLDGVTGFMLRAVEQVASWPHSAIRVPAFAPFVLISFYSGLALAVRTALSEPGARKGHGFYALSVAIGLVPLLLYALLSASGPKGLKITFLDAGQGDSAVIELPDGKTVVVDTGRDGLKTAGYLRYRGVEVIDALALSHGQRDHAGGLAYLLQRFKVREIWDNGRLIYPDAWAEQLLKGVSIRHLERGDEIAGDGYVITVVHPYPGYYPFEGGRDDENNDSLALKVRGSASSFLFAGDLEVDGEQDMAALGSRLQSTVLKVPHHGSRSSASELFISTVAPQIAVISVGRGNAYNHPHMETLTLLERVKIYRTDRDGAVGFRETSGGGLEVKTWKEFSLKEAAGLQEEVANIKRLFSVW